MSVSIIEEELKSFNGFEFKCNREQTVLFFNSSQRYARPSACKISTVAPSVKFYFGPLCGVVVKCYLNGSFRFVVTAFAFSTIFNRSFCLFIYFPFTVLVTGSFNSNCLLADNVSQANRAVNYEIVASVFSTCCRSFIFLNCFCRCVTESLALNYATVFTSLGSFASCVCPNVICAKVCFASIAVAVVIFVNMTKLCNNLCVCMLIVVSTCICLNAFFCTCRSCCYHANVVVCSSVNRNNLCVSITAFASECLNTGSCTSSSGGYFFSVFTNVNALDNELAIGSNCDLICAANNNLNIAVFSTFLEVSAKISRVSMVLII